jgi:amidohydrolase
LGVNAIDAAAAVVNAVNAIRINPVVPCTVKTTKLQAGGATLNAIPDLAEMAFDLRAQQNDVMDELIAKVTKAVENAAVSVGAKGTVKVKGGVPAAEYNDSMVATARSAINSVLGPVGVLAPIVSPGGEDFHFFVKKYPQLKAGYIGLGCDLKPGLHHPAMSFDLSALPNGVKILVEVVNRAYKE